MQFIHSLATSALWREAGLPTEKKQVKKGPGSVCPVISSKLARKVDRDQEWCGLCSSSTWKAGSQGSPKPPAGFGLTVEGMFLTHQVCAHPEEEQSPAEGETDSPFISWDFQFNQQFSELLIKFLAAPTSNIPSLCVFGDPYTR